MQRGLSKYWPWRATAVLAESTALSCGTGIRDGDGYVYMSKTIDFPGDTLVLREATVAIPEASLLGPTLITLRRFSTLDHSGAVSPVFEIQVPTDDAFQIDPWIEISTSQDVAGKAASVIGFLDPGVPGEQWVPDSNSSTTPCTSPPPVVCGPVQRGGFRTPGGGYADTFRACKSAYAIVTKCASPATCPIGQTCTSTACQACNASGPCN